MKLCMEQLAVRAFSYIKACAEANYSSSMKAMLGTLVEEGLAASVMLPTKFNSLVTAFRRQQ